MTVLTVDFEMAFSSALRIKPNNIIAFFFLFLRDFIQLCDSRIRDSCEIDFRVQFNAEFSHQVINFPIKLFIIWQAPRAGSMRLILCSDWLSERARLYTY